MTMTKQVQRGKWEYAEMWKMVFKNKELRSARGKNGENREHDRETKR